MVVVRRMPLPPAMPEASPEPEPEPEAELDPDPLGPGTGVEDDSPAERGLFTRPRQTGQVRAPLSHCCSTGRRQTQVRRSH